MIIYPGLAPSPDTSPEKENPLRIVLLFKNMGINPAKIKLDLRLVLLIFSGAILIYSYNWLFWGQDGESAETGHGMYGPDLRHRFDENRR